MPQHADIILFGTGEFGARMLFDLAATAREPVTVLVVGRSDARLAWLRTAANARAHLFNTPARIITAVLPEFDEASVQALVRERQPKVVVQSASLQTASVLRESATAWSQLVAQGGWSITAAFQSVLSVRIGRAVHAALPGCRYINCCFPDVANALIVASGVPVYSGVGNIGILSTAFAGALGIADPRRLRMLAQYQQLNYWRKPAGERSSSGSVPRVWLDGVEMSHVGERLRDVMLSPQTAFDISCATGVPLILALVAGREWFGHVPGPDGLPGGYPVRVDASGNLHLDLPPGLSREEAIAWNLAFEERNGLVVDGQGNARYTGVLHKLLQDADPVVAAGFKAGEVEAAATRLAALRDRLQSLPAAGS